MMKTFLDERFCMHSFWAPKAQTLGEFIKLGRDYVEKLQPLHSLFQGPLYLTGKRAKDLEILQPDLSNLADFLQRNGWDRKAPANWNTGVGLNKTMSLLGTSEVPFSLSISSTGNTLKPNGISIRISSGSLGDTFGGLVHLYFPTQDHPEFGQLEFVKSLVKVSRDCFQPDSIAVTSYAFSKAQENTASIDQEIGWMNYFSDAKVRHCLPPNVDNEPFGPNGILLTLQKEPPSPEDEKVVQRAKHIQEWLSQQGWYGA
jgi:Immunity protein 52